MSVDRLTNRLSALFIAILALLLLALACGGQATPTQLAQLATPTRKAETLTIQVESTPTPSSTPAPTVTVPVVTGQYPEEAILRLQKAGLEAEKVETPASSCNRLVMRQEPAMGELVQAGTTVRIFFCSGPTPTPRATSSPLPTRTPMPTVTPWPAGLLFIEDFSAKKASIQRGWSAKSDETVQYVWSPSGLAVSVNKENWMAWNMPDKTFDDFGLEVEAQAQSSGYGEYGVVFRSGDNDRYFFGITTEGECFLKKFVDGEWANAPLSNVAWRSIAPGQAKNRLGVLAKASEISLYINGSLVRTIVDKSIADGKVGIFVGAGSTYPVVVVFNRLTVLTVDRAMADWSTPSAVQIQPTKPPAPPTGTAAPRVPTANSISNFRIATISDSAIEVTVDYCYTGDHGEKVLISADTTAVGSNAATPWAYAKKIGIGCGSVSFQVVCPAGGVSPCRHGITTDAIWVRMYTDWWGNDFCREMFLYTKTWTTQ